MNPRIAPLVRVVGGLSLALVSAQVGLQYASEQAEAPPPTLEDLVKLPEPAPALPEPVRPALAPLPRFTVPSVHPMDASCGAACGVVAATAGLFWDHAGLSALHVSAPVLDDAAARGADVPIALAHAAAHGAVHGAAHGPAQTATPPITTPAAPQEPSWPAPPPPLSPAPGSRAVEPVVAALFEPDLTPPTDTGLEPATTEPQSDGNTPMAGPLGATTTPEGLEPSATADPPAPAGTPFKRSNLPGDKAGGRPPAPLAQGPVDQPYAAPRGPAQDPGPSSTPPFGPAQGQGPFGATPPGPAQDQGPYGGPTSDTPGPGYPWDGPNHSPGQPLVFPGQPEAFPGHVPVGLPDPVPGWIAPTQNQGPGALPPTQPLLEDPRVADRVAGGEPSDPLLTPRFDPVALPADLVDPALVTEPGALALLAAAAMGLAAARRPRRPNRPAVPGHR